MTVLWCALTVAWVAFAGALPAPLAGLLPDMVPMRAAFLMFIAGMVALVVVVYAVSAVIWSRRMAGGEA